MATRQEGRGNIALLIDSDNASAAHFDSVMTVLAELGTVNIRRAYGNWSKTTLKAWAALSITQAIEPQQQFDLTAGKNATVNFGMKGLNTSIKNLWEACKCRYFRYFKSFFG